MTTGHDIGLIGLAVMGQNLVLNIASRGFKVSVYNRTHSTTEAFVAAHPGQGISGCASLQDLVQSLAKPRKVMLMVQAGAAVDAVIAQLIPLLDAGDIVIDGGNSFYADTERRDAQLAALGLRFVGAGVSGGEEGARKGPAIMPGGPASTWRVLQPIFEAIAAKVDGQPCVVHIGPGGAGHYVKMIHNGIEYGMLQAYAEGYEILHASRDFPALDLHQGAELWQQGSVVRSWLNELAVRAFAKDAKLDKLKGYVADSGEGRWTVAEAIEEDVPAAVITLSLLMRLRSRQEDSFGAKVIAALRNEFGGHAVKGS